MVAAFAALAGACAGSGDNASRGVGDVGVTTIDPVTGLPVTGPGGGGTTIDPVTGLPVDVPVGGGGGSGDVPTLAGTPLPCDVGAIVQNNCTGCHGATPIGGAPMPLVTHEDWQADHVVAGLQGASVALKGQTMKVYEIAKLRINEMAAPMPPTGAMSADALAALDGWLSGGAAAGSATDCSDTVPPTTADDWLVGQETYCDAVDAYGRTARDPLVARPGETCYEFLTHDKTGVTDTTPFQVQLNENYHEIHYDIPWPANSVMTRFGADFDNEPVLHHYLLFHSHAFTAPGTVVKNVLGTTLLTDARLLAGWAVGGCGQEGPPESGNWLPNPGDGHIMIQWHHYNSTGSIQPDSSKVQICTVPASERQYVGDVTHLGTEFDGRSLPPGASNFTTDCVNNSGESAFVFGWMPHMHLMGVNMKTAIKRLDGSITTVFDRSFKFDYQIGYPHRPALEVKPGETLITTCSFMNTTGGSIAFGQSTNDEMCYQFASYYPKGALVNGIPSLLGSTNTCWGPVR